MFLIPLHHSATPTTCCCGQCVFTRNNFFSGPYHPLSQRVQIISYLLLKFYLLITIRKVCPGNRKKIGLTNQCDPFLQIKLNVSYCIFKCLTTSYNIFTDVVSSTLEADLIILFTNTIIFIHTYMQLEPTLKTSGIAQLPPYSNSSFSIRKFDLQHLYQEGKNINLLSSIRLLQPKTVMIATVLMQQFPDSCLSRIHAMTSRAAARL